MKSVRAVIVGIFITIVHGAVVFFGVSLFRHADMAPQLLQILLTFFFGARAMLSLGVIVVEKTQTKTNQLLRFIFNALMFLITLGNGYAGIFSVSFAFAIVLVLDGLVKITCSYIYRKLELKNWWQEGIFGLLSIILAGFFVLPDTLSMEAFVKLMAIYIVLLGVIDFFGYLFQGNSWNDVKKRWKFQFLHLHKDLLKNSFLPAEWFNNIEKKFKEQNDLERFLAKEKMIKQVNLEHSKTMTLLIHSWDEHAQTMKGHADIMIDGLCYSYGNYDASSHQLFGALSDGCLVISEKDAYIDYCLQEEGKVLLLYTLRVTDIQYEKALDFLHEMKHSTRIWHPTIEEEQSNNAGIKIMRAIGAEIYKFKRTQFKYFFVLDTNCVRFVEQLLKAIDFDEANIHGIVTPGDYVDFFEKKMSDITDDTVIARRVLVNPIKWVLDNEQ